MKTKYIIAILISVGIFNSCSGLFINRHITEQTQSLRSYPIHSTKYGAYLAARVAHIRQNYNLAADYYVKAIKEGADDADLLNRIYLLLTTQGRIDEAAEYAKKAIKEDDNSNFIHFVIMANEAKNKNYDKAIKSIDNIKDEMYQKSIGPLFKAWLYAAKNEKQKALEQLEVFKKDEALLSFYYMHRGMIHDYFNDTKSAQTDFEAIILDDDLEISFRSLQIITNFYLRNNQPQKAQNLIKTFAGYNTNTKVLSTLLENIQKIEKNRTLPLIDTPEKGLGEAIFNIAVIFRDFQTDIAQIFTALALYLNPENDVALISSADLSESNNRFTEAIKQYNKLSISSPLHYMAHLKISTILMNNQQFDESVQILKNMLKTYPDDYNILFNLGEINRMTDNNKDAITYYNKALDVAPKSTAADWTVYYALGMAYERNNQWNEAENVLKKALSISNRHPFILNYLGYVWLENNQNYNEALYMIFEAYQQNPENGHIMDSMGWALYRMGKFDDALNVLEKAAEYLPANAVVCDHLGDVYWQVGRKNEAKYQWQHALTLKEDTELLNKELIKEKLKNGAPQPISIIYNESLLVERLKMLSSSE
ncbi:MAG: tetratricopeptide repeat protein [Alphaproteobacteria bacterium]|nr:tetratricopeptide repeat protein [Alphaproteobacteria bacterium]